MSFCPKCSYTMEISKSNEKKKEEIITNITTFINTILNNSDEDNKSYANNISNMSFTIEQLSNNIKFKKIDESKQQKILNIFNIVIKNKQLYGKDIKNKCLNCGYIEPLTPGSILYHKSFNNSSNVNRTVLNKNLLCNDQTLPRTKMYICPNKSCITNIEGNEIMREAIMKRDNKTYKLTYICCICNTMWNI